MTFHDIYPNEVNQDGTSHRLLPIATSALMFRFDHSHPNEALLHADSPPDRAPEGVHKCGPIATATAMML